MAEMVEAYITKNPYYRPDRKIKVRGLMLHSIGVGQPDPWVLQRNYNKADCYGASVHGFIGADETLITLPIFDQPGEAVQAFHCALSGNSTHIGIEMCEPGEIQYTGGATFLVKDVAKAIADIKAGKIEYRLDKTNIIHVPVGKASFTEEQLSDNFQTIISAINKARPAALKGQYLKSVTLTSTMGPGVRLNPVKLSN